MHLLLVGYSLSFVLAAIGIGVFGCLFVWRDLVFVCFVRLHEHYAFTVFVLKRCLVLV